ncbi:MAG TPA: hypothetical protein VGR00_08090, partial [Thermoanaerobaculia bacterium]|nr:hypothetical protein [Thermoanaerobaculia bacterium]
MNRSLSRAWLGLVLFVPIGAFAQLAGPEFRVNTYTTNIQRAAAVAVDGSGNFVVVWSSQNEESAASGLGIFGQRYASSGSPVGGEFLVNSRTTNAQYAPSVASDSSGNFVVVWQGAGQDGNGYGVFGQRFNSAGTPAGAEFRVSSYTTLNQRAPAVAAAPSGDFVAVWESASGDGSSYGVFGQRYASSGSPLGSEFPINTF